MQRKVSYKSLFLYCIKTAYDFWSFEYELGILVLFEMKYSYIQKVSSSILKTSAHPLHALSKPNLFFISRSNGQPCKKAREHIIHYVREFK